MGQPRINGFRPDSTSGRASSAGSQSSVNPSSPLLDSYENEDFGSVRDSDNGDDDTASNTSLEDGDLDFTPQAYHPLNAINNFILTNYPKVNVVVTHDDDWMALLSDKDLAMPDDRIMEQRFREMYDIVAINGSLRLRARSPFHSPCNPLPDHEKTVLPFNASRPGMYMPMPFQSYYTSTPTSTGALSPAVTFTSAGTNTVVATPSSKANSGDWTFPPQIPDVLQSLMLSGAPQVFPDSPRNIESSDSEMEHERADRDVDYKRSYEEAFPAENLLEEPNDDLQPEYSNEGMRIGDVGIITDDGCFDYLFNICASADDPINSRGVPGNFVPLVWNNRSVKIRDIFRPGVPQCSRRAKQRQLSFEASATVPGSPIGLGGGIEVTFQQDSGAVLMPPKGADRIDCSQRASFRRYAEEHAQDWYRFVNGTLGREAENGSIYLVTGFDKADAWETALFDSTSSTRSCSLIFTTSGVADGRMKLSQSSLYQTSVTSRCCANDAKYNQTLFMRGFRVSIRQGPSAWFLGSTRVISTSSSKSDIFDPVGRFHSGGPYPGSPPRGSRSGSSNGSGRSSSGSTDNDTDSDDYGGAWDSDTDDCGGSSSDTSFDDGDFDELPAQIYHPLNAINNFLLETNPELDVIVTHDEVWMKLLTDGDTIMPDDEVLIQRLQERFDISVMEGSILLELRDPSSWEPSSSSIISAGPRDSSREGEPATGYHPNTIDANSQIYSFVALPGNTVRKRPRSRYDEIERLYGSRSGSDEAPVTMQGGNFKHSQNDGGCSGDYDLPNSLPIKTDHWNWGKSNHSITPQASSLPRPTEISSHDAISWDYPKREQEICTGGSQSFASSSYHPGPPPLIPLDRDKRLTGDTGNQVLAGEGSECSLDSRGTSLRDRYSLAVHNPHPSCIGPFIAGKFQLKPVWVPTQSSTATIWAPELALSTLRILNARVTTHAMTFHRKNIRDEVFNTVIAMELSRNQMKTQNQADKL
ncbi:hypothetical protein VNI00_009932 [Paramarasmius palmivorus]|uniref:Uncharacterized protein n=1 Tax=Paramarasmius palmivorus TaxID=297713 RepID=A0AAW0CMJ0_9AGAR